MAVTNKTYLDLAGLTAYNGKIKDWSNSIAQAGIKTVLKTADGNTLKFYKKPSALLTDTADFSIDLGSAEAATKIAALATTMGATWNSSTSTFDLTGLDSSISSSATTVVAAINEVISDFNTIIGEIPDGATATTVVGYAKEVADAAKAAANSYTDSAIGNLDVSEFAIAAKDANDIITVHGISETNGEIAVGSNTANDVTFAKVAATGAAADVSVADTAGKLDATTVEGALAELADKAGAQAVYMTDNGATSDYAKVYSIYQGNGSAASPVPTEKIGDINIPKDKVVENGSVVDITYSNGKLYDGLTDVTDLIKGAGGTATEADAGKYIKLILQNVTNPLYISAKSLVDIYTGGTTAEATVTIDNTNEITVTINAIAATKITYGASSNVNAELDKIEGDASTAGSIAKAEADAKAYADGLVAGLDTSADVGIASYTAGTSGAADVITLTGSVAESDGVIKSGSADDITLSTITSAQINNLFS